MLAVVNLLFDPISSDCAACQVLIIPDHFKNEDVNWLDRFLLQTNSMTDQLTKNPSSLLCSRLVLSEHVILSAAKSKNT